MRRLGTRNVSYVHPRRPSWGYMPEGWTWRDGDRIDRIRVIAIVITIVVMFLAGASDLAR